MKKKRIETPNSRFSHKPIRMKLQMVYVAVPASAGGPSADGTITMYIGPSWINIHQSAPNAASVQRILQTKDFKIL